MEKIKLTTYHQKYLADTLTPVSLYLNLRDKFANTILLESSDYRANDNNYSYICCEPIAKFEVSANTITQELPGHPTQKTAISTKGQVTSDLFNFIQQFEVQEFDYKFITNGVFGYIAYDAVRYFEDIETKTYTEKGKTIPDILYHAYRFVIAINHFNNELHIFEHLSDNQSSEIGQFANYLKQKNTQAFGFQTNEKEFSNFKDDEFLTILQKGKDHCQLGDVFQIVLSRRFSQPFSGDEFNVYRTLRSVNPSPYLYYFDYGSYKVFGSSPEAQIIISNDKASIHPIAGTFKRTGNDKQDAEEAERLFNDPKENAEHTMLVDLARNDLSRHGHNVTVDTFKEIQFYSHLIHLVSKVTADIKAENPLQLVGDTFPAGTLSGAPKYKAMELINEYENTNRGYYGGCIGFIGFNGNFNHAIMIRSFLSQHNQLNYQAGAGVVSKSNVQSELEEVNHKLKALRTAIELANTL